MTASDIPAPIRRLGLALRGLRLDAGLTGHQLAGRSGLSQSTVSRIELGQAMPSMADIEAWCEAAQASDGKLAEIQALAEAAAVETISWRRSVRRGLPALQGDVRDIEAATTRFLNFQPVIVPGLLQTAEYARQLVLSGYPGGRPDIGPAIAARMERQAVLYDGARHFEFVIAEAALRWRILPPAGMAAQLDRIASLGTLGNVTVGIIPQSAQIETWHIHGFNILDGRSGEPAIVRVETLTTGLSISDPDDVERYRQAFAPLRAASVTGQKASGIIESLRAELLKPGG